MTNSKTLEMVAIHTNHFQTSGNGWHINSSTIDMVEGDYYDLCEQYQRDQNVRVGDISLLELLPDFAFQALYLLGGTVDFQDETDTETWGTTCSTKVTTPEGVVIFENHVVVG